MGRRPANSLVLQAGDRAVLEAVREGPDPVAATRAQILLNANEGVSNTETAARLGTTRQSVLRWRKRYAGEGIDCLRDRQRSGRPPAISPATVLARTLDRPPTGESGSFRWSTRSLARMLGVSSTTVSRAWQRYNVRPREGGGVYLDTRPDLAVRAGTIIGLFAAPPFGFVVFHEGAVGAPAAQAPSRGSHVSEGSLSALIKSCSRESEVAKRPEAVARFLRHAGDDVRVIATGVGRAWLGDEGTALADKKALAVADTFSQWLQAVDVLEVATVASVGQDGLRECRSAVRRAAKDKEPAIWFRGDPALNRGGTSATVRDAGSAGFRVTMKEVAAEAGVSIKTVSNTLTGAKRVAPGTQQRVDEAVRHLGYQVNTAARQLRTGRNGAFVLAVPELRLSYFAELAEQIIDAAAQRQLSIFVQTTGGELERELQVIDQARRRADGVIIAAQSLHKDALRQLTTIGPLVLLGEAAPGIRADQITISNADAAYTAMDHLLALGRRRVVLLGVAPRTVAEARVRGCRSAADRHRINLEPDLMVPTRAWGRDFGEQAMLKFIERGIAFDAVIGFNDELALGAQHALLSRGINVPEDVAVVGFDNSENAVYSTPSLTSIAPAFDVIARTAVDLVDSGDAGTGSSRKPVHVIAPHRLMARQSTILSRRQA